MATAYGSSIALATRLIDDKGQSVTWRQRFIGSQGVGDPAHTALPVTTTDNSVKIVFLPNTKNRQMFQSVASAVGPTSRYYGLMASVGFVPANTDVVIRGGVEMQVRDVQPLNPDGTDILYTVEFDDET